MDVRAACRPITNPIRVLKNYASTIALCGVSGPRATGKEPGSTPRSFLGAFILTLVRLSLHSLESLATPHLLHLHSRAVICLYIGKTSQSTAMTSGPVEPVLSTSALLGNMRRRGRMTLLASHSSLVYNFSYLL